MNLRNIVARGKACLRSCYRCPFALPFSRSCWSPLWLWWGGSFSITIRIRKMNPFVLVIRFLCKYHLCVKWDALRILRTLYLFASWTYSCISICRHSSKRNNKNRQSTSSEESENSEMESSQKNHKRKTPSLTKKEKEKTCDDSLPVSGSIYAVYICNFLVVHQRQLHQRRRRRRRRTTTRIGNLLRRSQKILRWSLRKRTTKERRPRWQRRRRPVMTRRKRTCKWTYLCCVYL